MGSGSARQRLEIAATAAALGVQVSDDEVSHEAHRSPDDLDGCIRRIAAYDPSSRSQRVAREDLHQVPHHAAGTADAHAQPDAYAQSDAFARSHTTDADPVPRPGAPPKSAASPGAQSGSPTTSVEAHDQTSAGPSRSKGMKVWYDLCNGSHRMRATWKPHEKHGHLTERGDLPSSVYAFPDQRKEPMMDASHVRNAIARFDQVRGVSDVERDLAFANIKKAAKYYGVEVHEAEWKELGRQPSTGRPAGARRATARQAAATREGRTTPERNSGAIRPAAARKTNKKSAARRKASA